MIRSQLNLMMNAGSLLLSLLLSLALPGCGRQEAAVNSGTPAQKVASVNAVVDYFSGAEIQAETDAQRNELRKALTDMLTLPIDVLKQRRYAGFDGKPSARNLVEILSGHLVPTAPRALDAQAFFADLKAETAQAVVRVKLDELNISEMVPPK
jgi:hypothetical protein